MLCCRTPGDANSVRKWGLQAASTARCTLMLRDTDLGFATKAKRGIVKMLIWVWFCRAERTHVCVCELVR